MTRKPNQPNTGKKATGDLYVNPKPDNRSGQRSSEEVRLVSASYSGPIPQAQELAQYEHFVPGSADRIIAMAEKDQEHTHYMEEKVYNGYERVVQTDLRTQRYSLAASFAFGSLVVICATILIIAGHEGTGTAMLVTTGLGLAGSYYQSQRKQAEGQKPEIQPPPSETKKQP